MGRGVTAVEGVYGVGDEDDGQVGVGAAFGEEGIGDGAGEGRVGGVGVVAVVEEEDVEDEEFLGAVNEGQGVGDDGVFLGAGALAGVGEVGEEAGCAGAVGAGGVGAGGHGLEGVGEGDTGGNEGG